MKMIKIISFLPVCCFLLSFSTCGQINVQKERKQTMLRAIECIFNGDTDNLSNYVDTLKTFKMYGRDAYFSSVRKIGSKKLKGEIFSELDENLFELKSEEQFGTDYLARIYTSENKMKYYEVTFNFVGNSSSKIEYINFQYFNTTNPNKLLVQPKQY